MTTATQGIPTWDLSDLYKGVEDPNIEIDLKAQFEKAAQFEADHKSSIASESITAEKLRSILDTYVEIVEKQSKISEFAQLLFSTKTSDAAVGALLQKINEANSSIAKHFVFLDIEIGEMPDSTYQSIISDELLKPFVHYLNHQRKLASHQLSEAEEKILLETSNVRGPAFMRLFTEVNTRARFEFQQNGKVEQITQSELLANLYDVDRDVRKRAAQSFTAGLQENSHICTYIYNTLLHEKDVMDRLRNFENPESSRNLHNKVTKEIVDTMAGVCVENYDIVSDYYALKQELSGLDKLYDYDRYAPLLDSEEEIEFEDAKALVMEAFGNFSPRLAEETEMFFKNNWIDAAPADGKDSGAYCALGTPHHHPYVFMNYMGRPRDVMTLAHELGHAIHGSLSRSNHMLDFFPGLPLAETASTFGEALVFDLLMERTTDPKEKLALLCSKVEDSIATVFRQIGMYRFEQKAHQARREQGEIPTEAYSELWQSSMQEMFKDSLELTEDHAYWWLFIPHIMQVPFYVYAYAFGELLVFSLYGMYKREGDSFTEKYFQLLSAGGSKLPADLIGEIGFDIKDKAFWQAGCDLIRERVDQARELAKQIA